jgi:hypothetical protein
VVPESDTGGVPGLAADDMGVYLKTRTAVVRLGSDGGPPIKLATVPDSDTNLLAVDARYIYFSGPKGPMRVSLQGGASTPVGQGAANAIAVDSKAVYWLTSGNVMLVPKH